MKPGFAGALVGVAIGAVAALWSCTIDRPSQSLTCLGHADCEAGRICEAGYCIIGTLPVDASPPDAFECPAICGNCDMATTTCTITGTGSGGIACPAGWNCDISCPTAGACGPINCGSAASCDVTCTGTNACLGVSCMTANCDVTCTGAMACANVTCTSGNCTQTCSGGAGTAVCGSLSCGTGNCTRTCTGDNACGAMSCAGGACTETCADGSAACGNLVCGTGKCLATCQGSGAGGESACGNVACQDSCQCDVTCDDTTNICPATMTCPRSTGQNYCTPSQQQGDRCDSSVANQCKSC